MELIIDNFAGGGGASTGIEMATGRSVDVAINHDPAAIAMHKANHPETVHYNENVWDIDPLEVTQGRPVGLCWFSPDCTHFSKAKGGKPRKKEIRGLAWVALRWAATVKPRVIMLENVEEFQDWGPLLPDGHPDPDKKGKTFRSFVNALKRQGYKVDWKELRACDYGAPTIRKRLFMVARRDGRPIVWPEPTHGPGTDKPYRTAGEIIDWSIPSTSIFERKRPLAENTMRRIARGIQKFVIESDNPYIVPHGAVFIAKHYGGNYTGAGSDLNDPLHTVTMKDHNALVTAFLAQYYTETQPNEVRGQELNAPIMTIPTANRYALVTAYVAQQYKSSIGHALDQPLNAITTVNKASLVQAFLVAYYGSSTAQSLNDPLGTVTTRDRFGLVTIHGKDYQIVDIGMRMLEPHELFAAQGFPSNYIIDKDADGKRYPKSAQVARCGNSVPPPFAEALVRANLPELCTGSGKAFVVERYKEAAGQLQLTM